MNITMHFFESSTGLRSVAHRQIPIVATSVILLNKTNVLVKSNADNMRRALILAL